MRLSPEMLKTMSEEDIRKFASGLLVILCADPNYGMSCVNKSMELIQDGRCKRSEDVENVQFALDVLSGRHDSKSEVPMNQNEDKRSLSDRIFFAVNSCVKRDWSLSDILAQFEREGIKIDSFAAIDAIFDLIRLGLLEFTPGRLVRVIE